jgi:cysteine sulfinate desulfinase/cysteine desulfurase-like protein
MGMDPGEALASIRVSFGMTNTAGEVDRFVAALGREVAALRGLLDAAQPGVAAGPPLAGARR